MDFGCVCVSVSDYDYDQPELYKDKIVKARKEHKCCECGERIAIGERHEHAKGKWDGNWDSYRTCLFCTKLRAELCCFGGWIFGELRELVWEVYGLDYVTNDTIEDE